MAKRPQPSNRRKSSAARSGAPTRGAAPTAAKATAGSASAQGVAPARAEAKGPTRAAQTTPKRAAAPTKPQRARHVKQAPDQAAPTGKRAAPGAKAGAGNAASARQRPAAPSAETTAAEAVLDARNATETAAERPRLDSRAATADHRVTRIPAIEVWPVIENGAWPAKAVAGEAFPVRATVFREGHAALAAEAVLYDPEGTERQRALMHDIAPGLDRYEAWLRPTGTGDWTFSIHTWSDPFATWAHDASVKIAADIDVELMLAEGAALMRRAAAQREQAADTDGPADAQVFAQAAERLQDTASSPQTRLSAGLHARVRHLLRAHPLRDMEEETRRYPIQVDRERALVGAWYEVFPRSLGAHRNDDGTWTSGTLRTAAEHLPRIAEMGFDVCYLTPVHPIGTTMRKGRNNTLIAQPGDPGSPYGIGSPDGGHDAINPELGTFADFDAFVARARELGMEVALDLALQCSPDHPWVREHPQWFTHRSDGSIAYAENPPKKYQDIYPLNFDNDYPGIYQAIVDVVETWISHGVTIFRVDNPHTKPLRFWQEFLAQMRADHPDILFLAEAFTRPAMMRGLGEVGFHQSYTYFAWRNSKEEITSYFQEVANDLAHLMRPTFWPSTHDILTQVLVEGGLAAHKIRAVLAATGAPSYGIYNGYELCENVQRPGFEEHIDNEKYEYKPRDYTRGTGPEMTRLLTTLNRVRHDHPALQRLRNITFHRTTHPDVVCYSRRVAAWESPTGAADTVIVVVNLNPHQAASGLVTLDLAAIGAEGGYSTPGTPVLRVRDQLDGQEYNWGQTNYFELHPEGRFAHVFSVEAL